MNRIDFIIIHTMSNGRPVTARGSNFPVTGTGLEDRVIFTRLEPPWTFTRGGSDSASRLSVRKEECVRYENEREAELNV